MESLNKLKEYATATDNWYIKNQIWHIEKEIEIAISEAKIQLYKELDTNL